MTNLAAEEILMNSSCAAAILLVAFCMFARGWVGGGDAKLASAAAMWLGWGSIADYFVATAICGGFLTLLILTARKVPLPAMLANCDWIARLHNSRSGVPYGIALAAAGLIQYPGSRIWAGAITQ
jgi:prepilin peptidase CpaA